MDFPTNLIISTIPQKHIMDKNVESFGEPYTSGVDGCLLKIISEVLKFPPNLNYGKKDENGNWSGIIGMVQRGEADLGIGQIAVTRERMEVVDFSVPYTNQDVTFLIKKPGLLPVSWTIFCPFEGSIWILLLCALIITPAVYRLLLNVKVSYSRVLIHFYTSIFGKSIPVKDNSIKVRSLIAFWIFFALIITNSYTASLLSYLTLPLHQKAVKNFKELSSAVRQGTHKCLAITGLSRLRYVDEESIRYLGEAIIKNRWYVERTKGLSKDQISVTTAVIDLRFVLEMLTAELNSDSYIISDDALFSWSIAIAFRKDFCCKTKINRLVERILNAGIYEKFIRDARRRVQISTRRKISHYRVKPVCIHDIMAPCLLLVVGYIVSILTLIGEIIFCRISGKFKRFLEYECPLHT
ncbi:hypothetical protein AVEN_179623-1 [Araneus ventricosus]|uniref:Ionotropic glutamate receptor L-glutamate and glycine-binding domain-containing protein n=1 Tax=Araneus ventricosus TaxID=182803 RepID=A0A4Y2BFE5_ARAVE|nr:hypothetical protein AVEN_179623-1 [Araneus ventricosus]